MMPGFDKIYFISDFCEPGREFLKQILIRKIAEKDWEEAYRRVLRINYFFLLAHNFPIYSATWKPGIK